MELLTLTEIPGLDAVFSDEKYVYIPLYDDRIIMHTLLTTNNNHSYTNFYYNDPIKLDGKWYDRVAPATKINKFSKQYDILLECEIDDGIWLGTFPVRWLNVADYLFVLGVHYAEIYKRHFENLNLPPFEDKVINETTSVDPKGYKLKNYCKKNKHYFLHPTDMMDEEMPQYFIPAFKHRYNAPFQFAGAVYEDEYNSWMFIESTETTIAQAFLLGASWELNYLRIKSLIPGELWKDKSVYQYSAWLAFEPDFSKKWPWSKDYDGSIPNKVVQYLHHR